MNITRRIINNEIASAMEQVRDMIDRQPVPMTNRHIAGYTFACAHHTVGLDGTPRPTVTEIIDNKTLAFVLNAPQRAQTLELSQDMYDRLEYEMGPMLQYPNTAGSPPQYMGMRIVIVPGAGIVEVK